MELEAEFSKTCGNFQLDIDLRTRADRVGILGASGAGKSMTLKMLAGIMTPDRGRLRYNGRDLLDTGRRINIKPQKRKIGYMLQNYALFPSMTVEGNIGAGISGKTGDREKIIRQMVERFHLKGLEGQLPSELSGGQQQRVAMARILASSPDMILLDEPFSALDVHLRDRMQRELLNQLEDYPGMVFMVSHNRDEIYRFSREILIMDQGRIICQGSREKVFKRPATKKAAAMTGCKNFSRAVRINDHSLRAENWGLTIRTRKRVPEHIRFIGCRAHQFLPVWGQAEDNCIPFILDRKDQLPFEENYYIRPDRPEYEPEDVISWFVQRDLWDTLSKRGLPDYLKIREEDILYFSE